MGGIDCEPFVQAFAKRPENGHVVLRVAFVLLFGTLRASLHALVARCVIVAGVLRERGHHRVRVECELQKNTLEEHVPLPRRHCTCAKVWAAVAGGVRRALGHRRSEQSAPRVIAHLDRLHLCREILCDSRGDVERSRRRRRRRGRRCAEDTLARMHHATIHHCGAHFALHNVLELAFGTHAGSN